MMQKRWGRQLASTQAPLKFGPEEGMDFYRQYGWNAADFRSFFEEGHRLNREMPLAWLWRLIFRLSSEERREKFRRTGAAVLLERI